MWSGYFKNVDSYTSKNGKVELNLNLLHTLTKSEVIRGLS